MISLTTITCLYITGTFPTTTYCVTKYIIKNTYSYLSKLIKPVSSDPNEQQSKKILEITK